MCIHVASQKGIFFSLVTFLCKGCLMPARMMWRGRPYSWTAVRRSLLLSIVHGAYPVGPHRQPHMEGTFFIFSSLKAEGCSRAAAEGRGAHAVQLWLRILGWGGELQGCMGEARLGPGRDLFNGSAEDRLIKALADGLGYGTHVCAQPHDAHPSQLTG